MAASSKSKATKAKVKAKPKPRAKPKTAPARKRAKAKKGEKGKAVVVRRAPTVSTLRARRIFLIVLEKTCNVSHAARAAGVDRTTPYHWRQIDSAFDQAWRDAEEAAVDKLEQVAYERAIKGESDRMLEILLKSHRPFKYVEKQQVLHAHALTKQSEATLERLGMSLEQAAQLYREKLG